MPSFSMKALKSVLLSLALFPLIAGTGILASSVTLAETLAQVEQVAGYYGENNPCAANPCAANPCAANPCAANPCAANPCAAAEGPELSDAQAVAFYKTHKNAMAKAYKKSGLSYAATYQTWKRYNTVPYISDTHGGRYVNNYANAKASAYGKYEKSGRLPEGAILVKDSFTGVAVNGGNPCAANPCAANPCAANPCAANPCAANPCAANPCAANPCAANPCAANPCAANPCAANPCAATPCAASSSASPIGPLFVMEKMAPGFNAASGDWRYTMALPNGHVLGTTNGKGSDKVEFCIACHATAEDYDHLMFIPEEYRK